MRGSGTPAEPPGLGCCGAGPGPLAGRRRNLGWWVIEFEFEGDGAAAWCEEGVDGRGDDASPAAVSCSGTRFEKGTRACGLGAAAFLKIGLGRGRVGDGDPRPVGLLAAPGAAAALGEGGEGGG